MIPTRLTLTLLALWAVLGLAAAVWPDLQQAWVVYAVVFAAAFCLDVLRGRRRPGPRIERRLPKACALGQKTEATIRLHNEGGASMRLWVHDHVPDALSFEHLPQATHVPPHGFADICYVLRAVRRGEHHVGPVSYRMATPWGLCLLQRRDGPMTSLRVFPDFQAVARYALLARDERLREIGVHSRRRRGEGRDFHQLRDYRVGDSLRQIDWCATARIRKAISREYRDERDQRVVFLLDHGRRMRTKEEGDLSHLDHALNATLLLAYVALRQGDAVGLMTFGGGEQKSACFMAPRKGKRYLAALQNGIFDLESTSCASDLNLAMEQALGRVLRRALLVVVTNLRDDPDDDTLEIIRMAQKKHLVLIASLREQGLRQALARPPRGFREALTTAATHQYLRHRDEAHRRLRRAGAQCLDVEPRELPLCLVNRYLDIKRTGTL